MIKKIEDNEQKYPPVHMSRQNVLVVLASRILYNISRCLKFKKFQIFKNVKNIIIKILLNLIKIRNILKNKSLDKNKKINKL